MSSVGPKFTTVSFRVYATSIGGHGMALNQTHYAPCPIERACQGLYDSLGEWTEPLLRQKSLNPIDCLDHPQWFLTAHGAP